jgi:hypothetical protein
VSILIAKWEDDHSRETSPTQSPIEDHVLRSARRRDALLTLTILTPFEGLAVPKAPGAGR